MAKQTFTSGQVLTATQVNGLQTNDFNQTVSTKTAAYTFVVGDRGTRVVLNDTTPRTFTIDNSIFSAGDTIQVHNINTGVLTIAAGAGVTLNGADGVTLAQWQSGTIYFTSASSAILFLTARNKVVQIVTGNTSTQASSSVTSYADTNLTATITPTSSTNKVLVVVTQNGLIKVAGSADSGMNLKLFRGATEIQQFGYRLGYSGTSIDLYPGSAATQYLDSPATTSATTYKTQFANNTAAAAVRVQDAGLSNSTIVLYEVTP